MNNKQKTADSQTVYDAWTVGWADKGQYLAKVSEQWRTFIDDDSRFLNPVLDKMIVLMGLYAFGSEETCQSYVSQERLAICLGRGKSTVEYILDSLEDGRWFHRTYIPTRFGRKKTVYDLTYRFGKKPIFYSAYTIQSGVWAYLKPVEQYIYAMLLAESVHPLNAVTEGFYIYGDDSELAASTLSEPYKLGDFGYVPSAVVFGDWSVRLGVRKDYFRQCVRGLFDKGFATTAENVFAETDSNGEEVCLEDPHGVMPIIRPFPYETEDFIQHLVDFNSRIAGAAESCNIYHQGVSTDIDRKLLSRAKAPKLPARRSA